MAPRRSESDFIAVVAPMIPPGKRRQQHPPSPATHLATVLFTVPVTAVLIEGVGRAGCRGGHVPDSEQYDHHEDPE